MKVFKLTFINGAKPVYFLAKLAAEEFQRTTLSGKSKIECIWINPDEVDAFIKRISK